MAKRCLSLAVIVAMIGSCGGGSSGGGSGAFQLVEFLESGKDNIPRNRVLTFVFSAPVSLIQDFAERIKIENVQPGANSNFSRAIGDPDIGPTNQGYVVVADRVIFVPRLPQKEDRSDAGFRAFGNYIVFLKGGPDALTSTGGDALPIQQEFSFDTNDRFEDPNPAAPPRAQGIVARDANTGDETDLSRLHPRPSDLATMTNQELIDENRFVEPGAGGPPSYQTPWQFDLIVDEPLDPATVTPDNVELVEIFSNATDSGEVADPAVNNPGAQDTPGFGTAVGFRVPVNVTVVQSVNPAGGFSVRVRVTPLFTLVDNTRYRLTFSGSILGIDFDKTFIGDNGLTGDGQSLAGVLPEPGGTGYTTEFLVQDRPSIAAIRSVLFAPNDDDIFPEDGTTTNSPETDLNTALYDSFAGPGLAVGFLSAFGNESDPPISAGGAGVTVIDSGDTLNDPSNSPFTVFDLNPNDIYEGNPLPGDFVQWDSPKPTEFQVGSVTVGSTATLRFIGLNPVLIRVTGIVQVSGTIDISGANGNPGGGTAATGGEGGPGGFPGGNTRQGIGGSGQCTFRPGSCSNFQSYLSGCGPANSGFPFSENGFGPGRGLAGGEAYPYYASQGLTAQTSGTGGGGGSHATQGGIGEDRLNNGAPGSAGSACSTFLNTRNSGVIGVRGQPGFAYGALDLAIVSITWGGSGGGGGGSLHSYSFTTANQTGGAGGGGGGSLTIIAAGAILGAGATFDASGGDGGRGIIKNAGFSGWDHASGGGGAGAGGALALISGANIELTAGTIDATGGQGGVRGDVGTNLSCSKCNAGGNGGAGRIFLMDADGQISGLLEGSPGFYPNFSGGILTVSAFNADRFSTIAAVTQLFNVLAANPDYLDLAPGDVIANVSNDSVGQRIRILVSSARSDDDAPLNPDLDSEIPEFEVALVSIVNGAVNVAVTGDMDDLNPNNQAPARDAFARVRGDFEYDDGVEAALGPFASIDRVDISYTFNGPIA